MHTVSHFLRRPRPAARASAVAAALVLAVAACSDPFALKASYANMPFTYSVYALSSVGPANAPAALDLVGRTTVKVDGDLAFDVAFDVDKTGHIVIYPQKLVGTPLSGSRAVAMQRVSGGYESVLLAPQRDYQTDSSMVLQPGETVVIKLTSGSCLYQLSSDLYAKVVVDSVQRSGLMFGRGVVNPNCGFRSFAEGIPEK